MKKSFYLILVLSVLSLCLKSQINTFYWLNDGRQKILKNENLQAIECFNTVIKFMPESDEGYFLRAIAKYNLSDFRGALEDFTLAISNNKYNSNYYLYRGDTKERLFDFKGARDDYNRALDFNPDNVIAYICRGVNSIHLKKFDDALVDFSNAVKLNSRNSSAFLYRALGKQYKEQYDEALIDYNKAIGLDPKNADAYIKRGRNYYEMKDYKKAIADFDRALDFEPRNSFGYFNRALAKCESFDYMGALVDYNKVIVLDPENALTYFNRALLRMRINSPDSALLDFDKVISISPNNVISYFNRGIVLDKMKKHRKALDDFSKAIELNPEFASAYYYRSIERRILKDYYGAEMDYKKAAQLNSKQASDSTSKTLDSVSIARMTEFKAEFEEGNIQMAKIKELGVSRFSNSWFAFDLDSQKTEKQNPIFIPINDTIHEKYNVDYKIILTQKDISLFNDSVQLLEMLISGIDPNTSEIGLLFKRAVLKNQSRNYMGAIDDYNLMISLYPHKAVSYFGRANTRYELISIINSIREFNNEIVIGNDINKMKTTDNRKKEKLSYDGALEDYSKCLALDSEFYPAYFNWANVLIDAGEFTEAIKKYTKTLEIEPTWSQAYFNRGLTYIYLKETEKGCSDLSKAGELGILDAYSVIKKYCGK